MRTILAVGLLGVAAVSAQTYAADELNQISFADNQLDELVVSDPPVEQAPSKLGELKDRLKAGFRKVHDKFHDATGTKHGFLVEKLKAAHEKAHALTGTKHATTEDIKAILQAAHEKAHALTGTIHNEEKLQAILKAAHEKAHALTNTKHASLEEIKAILQAAHEKFHQATGTKHAEGETADNQLDELVESQPPVEETPKKTLIERAKDKIKAGFNKAHEKFHDVTGTKHASVEDIKAILKAAHEKAHALTGTVHDEERFKAILKAAHDKAHELTSTKHYTLAQIEEILKAAHEKLHQATGTKHSAAEDAIIKAAHDKAHALTGTKHPEEVKTVTA